MRIVTWNCCRGPAATKLALLDPLAPTIAIVQECARPAKGDATCLWFGDNARQGIAVLAHAEYHIEALPTRGAPRYTVPIQVTGPHPFLLLAVWSHYPYVQGVIRALDLYRDLISAQPTVVVGDFNSNAIWNRRRAGAPDHSTLVDMLAGFGLVSAYHRFYGEAHGAETHPTIYFRWQEAKPYHVDYCFVPQSWTLQVRSVAVGSYADFATASDHRPLIVDLHE